MEKSEEKIYSVERFCDIIYHSIKGSAFMNEEYAIKGVYEANSNKTTKTIYWTIFMGVIQEYPYTFQKATIHLQCAKRW